MKNNTTMLTIGLILGFISLIFHATIRLKDEIMYFGIILSYIFVLQVLYRLNRYIQLLKENKSIGGQQTKIATKKTKKTIRELLEVK